MDAPDEMVAKPAHEHALPEGYFMGASGDTLPFFDQEGRAIVLRFWPDGTVTWQLRGRGGEVLEPLVDAVKSAACLRSSDARLTLDGPDRRGWYVLRMDGAPVADLDPVESAAVAEVFAKAAQVLPPGVPLMQVDHAQPVPSSPDSGESRSRAAGPESEPAEPRRAGAPPHEASSYACERALRVVADLALLVQILWARYPVVMSPGQLGTFIDSLPDDHQFALMAATGQTYKGVSWESDHPTCVLIRELENQEEQG